MHTDATRRERRAAGSGPGHRAVVASCVGRAGAADDDGRVDRTCTRGHRRRRDDLEPAAGPHRPCIHRDDPLSVDPQTVESEAVGHGEHPERASEVEDTHLGTSDEYHAASHISITGDREVGRNDTGVTISAKPASWIAGRIEPVNAKLSGGPLALPTALVPG
jgi:hypothetical protein